MGMAEYRSELSKATRTQEARVRLVTSGFCARGGLYTKYTDLYLCSAG